MMNLAFWLIDLITEIAVFTAEAIFWFSAIGRHLTTIAIDLRRARRSLHQGVLLCPRGHEVPTDNEVYECTRCSFTYVGSIWQCANPECSATTPYANCPTCGLSVRNPNRWGRP